MFYSGWVSSSNLKKLKLNFFFFSFGFCSIICLNFKLTKIIKYYMITEINGFKFDVYNQHKIDEKNLVICPLFYHDRKHNNQKVVCLFGLAKCLL